MRKNKSFFINAGLIILIYLSFILLVTLGEWSERSLVKIGLLPLIAGLQNHLQILQHEGAHFNLHRDRKWNDFICDFFCTMPFLGWIKHYRHFHFLHHRHLLNPQLDPEIEFYHQQGYDFTPLSRKQKIIHFVRDLSGWHYLQFLFSFNHYLWNQQGLDPKLRLTYSEIMVMLIVLGIMFFFVPIKILAFYWFLPQGTFLFWFMKLHGLKEHSLRTSVVEGCTFNNKKAWPAKFFISPLNSNFHLEHHLKPGRPWYQLKGL